MAQDEKEDPTVNEEEDEDSEGGENGEDEPSAEEERDDEVDDVLIEQLEARVEELEALLEERNSEFSPAARWGGWLLGTFVGATTLALIVVLLGGGWSGECNCPEQAAFAGPDDQQQQQALDQLLRRNSSDFQQCFENWAGSNSEAVRPGWSVIVRLEIEATEEGRVQRIQVTGDDLPRPLGECLEQRVGRWTFPGAGPFTMELPFSVEGDDSDRPSGPSASDAGATPSDGGVHNGDGG